MLVCSSVIFAQARTKKNSLESSVTFYIFKSEIGENKEFSPFGLAS